MARSTFVRQALSQLTQRYDRLARWYRLGELLTLLRPGMRRKAVARLLLREGQSVLEIGCGTGRNLRLLVAAVGCTGEVIGVDASPGMLARARRLADGRDWTTVTLHLADAAELTIQGPVDAVLFSLSYSVLPDRERVLERAWEALRPGGALVVMDSGLPESRLGRLLEPAGNAASKAFLGDPYSRPWEDLRRFGEDVRTERFELGIYFICSVFKPVVA